MTLSRFLQKYDIKLSKAAQDVCEHALEVMGDAVDAAHDHRHVESILGNFDSFLQFFSEEERESFLSSIDLNVTLLAICCHDVWKSQQPNGTVFQFFKSYLYDGFGSVKWLRENSGDLTQEILKQTCDVIRLHGMERPIRGPGTEFELLKDFDEIEIYSPERVNHFENEIVLNTKITWPKYLLTKAYVTLLHNPKKKKKFFFEWTNREYLRRQKVIQVKFDRLLQKYHPRNQSNNHLSQKK